ncbi:MAG: hypothetical protein LH467_10955 [Gemmatimonadaceae bacterium]|nr:hypothetical protein [Gemmatimonadaceae bacterium]
MRIRRTLTALATTTLFGLPLAAAPLGAQAADTTRRWSLFGGGVATQGYGSSNPLDNAELGLGVDLRTAFPLPLRASLAFGHLQRQVSAPDLKYGTLSVDAIARPVPRIFGIQPYFIGGLGLATRAAYSGLGRRPSATDPFSLESYIFRESRTTWTFVEGGMGLDIGRAFVQFKTQVPVASTGDRRTPISVGFRF